MLVCGDFTGRREVRGLSGLIFDVDGVIFDSRASNSAYYNLIREALGLGPMDNEQEDYVHSHAVHDSLAFIVPREIWARVPEARAAVNYRRVLPHIVIEPGLHELLSAVKAAGLRQAIYTNRTTTSDLIMEYFGLWPYFDCVVTASDVRPKPHPEGMYRIMDMWGAGPGEIAYIGDSKVDAQAAAEAGVPFWSYKNEKLPAAMHISDFYVLRAGFVAEYQTGLR